MTDNQEKSSLRKIPNVGSQTEQDLIAMGYTSIASAVLKERIRKKLIS